MKDMHNALVAKLVEALDGAGFAVLSFGPGGQSWNYVLSVNAKAEPGQDREPAPEAPAMPDDGQMRGLPAGSGTEIGEMLVNEKRRIQEALLAIGYFAYVVKFNPGRKDGLPRLEIEARAGDEEDREHMG